MNWKLNGEGPVYLQLMAIIRGAVISGQLQPGQRVPAVRELATLAQVNPNTMQRALYELEREGIVISQGTIGRMVTTDPAVIQQARAQEVEKLAGECLAKFRNLGLNAQETGALLQRMGEKEEPL